MAHVVVPSSILFLTSSTSSALHSVSSIKPNPEKVLLVHGLVLSDQNAFFPGQRSSVFQHPLLGDVPRPFQMKPPHSKLFPQAFALLPRNTSSPSTFHPLLLCSLEDYFKTSVHAPLCASFLVHNGFSTSAPNGTKHTPEHFLHDVNASTLGSIVFHQAVLSQVRCFPSFQMVAEVLSHPPWALTLPCHPHCVAAPSTSHTAVLTRGRAQLQAMLVSFPCLSTNINFYFGSCHSSTTQRQPTIDRQVAWTHSLFC